MASRTPRFSTLAQTEYKSILKDSRSRYGKDQAIEYRKLIRSTLRTLTAQPEIGVQRDELFVGLRSFPVGSHNLFYMEHDRRIEVARILHQRQHVRPTDFDPDVLDSSDA